MEEAFELYAQAKEIFRQGAFNLRMFLSNSQCLKTKIDFAERLPVSDLSTDSTPASQEVKVLGVTWYPHSDLLVFDLSGLASAADDLRPTKRNLVSLIRMTPLGF